MAKTTPQALPDQADTLRRIMSERESNAEINARSRSRVLTICSGRNGIGKSFIISHIAEILARSGQKVLTLEKRRPSPLELKEKDFVLIDAGSGIHPAVLNLYSPVFETVIVLTPEPSELTYSYSMVKYLNKEAGLARIQVIVNQVTDGREGQLVFKKLSEIVGRYMDVKLDYLGHLQIDEKIAQAMMNQKILLDLYPRAPSVPCLELMVKRLRENHPGFAAKPESMKDDQEVRA